MNEPENGETSFGNEKMGQDRKIHRKLKTIEVQMPSFDTCLSRVTPLSTKISFKSVKAVFYQLILRKSFLNESHPNNKITSVLVKTRALLFIALLVVESASPSVFLYVVSNDRFFNYKL